MTAHGSSQWHSEHLHHFAHFGDRLAQLALDAHLQGHGAAGAGAAGALQPRCRHRPSGWGRFAAEGDGGDGGDQAPAFGDADAAQGP